MRLASRTVGGFNLTPCVYCGLTANTRDHFVPRSWRMMMTTWREGIWRDAPDTVPACSECNCIAGANPFPTLSAKRTYIKNELRRKHGRELAMPFRTDAELDEYGPTLRSILERAETQRLRLILRLAWPYAADGEVGAYVRWTRGDFADGLNAVRREEILA